MKNFKEIAEKCAAGEIYGTIILKDGREFYSKYLSQYIFNGQIVEDFYTIGLAKYLFHVDQIINFIPNNMQEQIKIDIPEGKVPVMEQTESGVVITWKEKELTYTEIVEHLRKDKKVIYHVTNGEVNSANNSFITKINAIRKLINIRNYFGVDPHRVNDWVIRISVDGTYYAGATKQPLRDEIVFSRQEHAEQAIKMLGDELKYLFEPW